jgi:hypothetical protein
MFAASCRHTARFLLVAIALLCPIQAVGGANPPPQRGDIGMDDDSGIDTIDAATAGGPAGIGRETSGAAPGAVESAFSRRAGVLLRLYGHDLFASPPTDGTTCLRRGTE